MGSEAEVTAYLGLGSNLGDRRANIEHALARLGSVPGVRVGRVSRLVETDPVGGPPQPRYLNGAAEVATTLPPHALLAVMQRLEADAGRERSAVRDSPRPLDLDLLLYGQEEIDTRDLVVPHPRLHEREFAKAPLRELGVTPERFAAPARPRVVREVGALAALCTRWLQGRCSIGLVPTMGALHEGHASLVRKARAECDRVVATVFVNPLQFAPHEDLTRYPRTFPHDVELCRAAGADAVFAPDVAGMYPEGFASRIAAGREAEGMEGAARPAHFSGVATVVAKLFAVARPTAAYFGEKDAQQVAVLRRLVRDLGFPLELRACPIVREADGLAMSSRNVFLGPEDRRAATVLYRALGEARDAHARGERDAARLLGLARERIELEARARLEYLELRNEGDLLPLAPEAPVVRARLLVVARFGEPPVRLLDNITLGDGGLA
jgi:pantoate--beta-alanine ligase